MKATNKPKNNFHVSMMTIAEALVGNARQNHTKSEKSYTEDQQHVYICV